MLDEAVSSTPTLLGTLYSWFTPTVFFLLLQLVIGTIFIISNLANSHKHAQHQDHPNAQAQDFPHHHLPRSPSMLQRLKSINFYPSPYRSQDPHYFPESQTQTQTQTQTHQNEPTQLARSPSVLQRLKSINLYSYFPTEALTHKLTPDPHVPQKSHVPDPTPPAVETHDHEEDEDEDDDFLVENDNYNYNLGERAEGSSSLDEIYSKLQQGQEGHFTRTHSDTKPASGEVPVKLPRKMKKSASSRSAFSHFKEQDIVETRRPATVREPKVTASAVDDAEVDAKADDFINKFKQQLKLQRLDSIMRYKEMIGRGAAKS
ncbi:hypothetical protein VNO78_28999 [Psophocarpus tetragonolobus]|uniref:DUF4408 domain-containing protein n=1 Tax=Psophocarpus tetragonolobus TaxID=3891 RepID=A0AAN9WZQ2_PSOTE